MIDADITPERELLAGVLDRAIRDASGLGWDCDRWIQESALEWFDSKSLEPFSFLWICSHLDLCPVRLRRAPELFAVLAKDPRSKTRIGTAWGTILASMCAAEGQRATVSLPSYYPVLECG